MSGTPPLLTEAGGFGGPAAVGLAGAGRVPQQQVARPAAVAHHRAHPPVVAVHQRVEVGLGPPAVHWGRGRSHKWDAGCRRGARPQKRTAPKPGRRRTSAEGFVAQPAAAAGPARAPLQLLVLPLAAPQADGRCAGPVGVLGRWQRGGEGHSGVRGAEEHPAPQPHSPQGAGVSPKAPKFSFQPARPSPVPNFSAGPRRGARSLLVPAAPGCFASPPPRSQTPRCYLLGTRRSPAWPAGRGRGAPAP